MRLLIDAREQKRVELAKQYYTKQNLEVSVEQLPVGDFIFTDGDNSVCFEFKEVNDFITSITDGRVFNQAITMCENFDYHFVIIRGTEKERAKALALTKHYQPVTIFQYYGAIASLNRYTTVIESYSSHIEEVFYRMYIQAKKCLQNRPIVKKFPRKDKNSALNFLCHDVYGLNYKRAKLIVDMYNLHSLNDLMKLTPEMLTRIKGVGKNTADKIISGIQGE